MFQGKTPHSICGAWLLISCISGSGTTPGQVRSNLPEAKGARAMFEGVAIMTLHDGLIAEYHEVANTATGFVDMNFAPARIAKIMAKQGAALKARPEMARHLK